MTDNYYILYTAKCHHVYGPVFISFFVLIIAYITILVAFELCSLSQYQISDCGTIHLFWFLIHALHSTTYMVNWGLASMLKICSMVRSKTLVLCITPLLCLIFLCALLTGILWCQTHQRVLNSKLLLCQILLWVLITKLLVCYLVKLFLTHSVLQDLQPILPPLAPQMCQIPQLSSHHQLLLCLQQPIRIHIHPCDYSI